MAVVEQVSSEVVANIAATSDNNIHIEPLLSQKHLIFSRPTYSYADTCCKEGTSEISMVLTATWRLSGSQRPYLLRAWLGRWSPAPVRCMWPGVADHRCGTLPF